MACRKLLIVNIDFTANTLEKEICLTV